MPNNMHPLTKKRNYLLDCLSRCKRFGWLIDHEYRWREILAETEEDMRREEVEILTIRKAK